MRGEREKEIEEEEIVKECKRGGTDRKQRKQREVTEKKKIKKRGDTEEQGELKKRERRKQYWKEGVMMTGGK